MLPVDTRTWAHRVPGYIPESDEDEQDPDEDEFVETAQERLEVIARTLGPKWRETPIVEFSPVPLHSKGRPTFKSNPEHQSLLGGKPTPPNFRIHGHAPIVAKTLLGNGMLATAAKDWTVQWAGAGMRDSAYLELSEFQRTNHFPGSTELTRKDRLWRHFNEMKQAFGEEHFDFLPETYVIPDQVEEFLDCYEKTNYTWIVKPNNSAQGKGIFLLRDLGDLPLDECSVVSRYVDNPLLIQALKWDLRIYVLVTSYTPLRAYVYREGLTRFASSPYNMDPAHLNDAYRHLTNYSVNKTAFNFVENQEEESDNVGHKWSLSALNRHLNCVGINVNLMWARIMDLIVKILFSVESSIAGKAKSLHAQNNCFEIYGFDVLVDDALKPWLLEVNLSPSMKGDSPLDYKVKSTLLADAFNLVGISSPDRQAVAASRLRSRIEEVRAATIKQAENRAATFARRNSATEALPRSAPKADHHGRRTVDLDRLTDEQLRTIALALQEATRNRNQNFIRLHPTRTTSERYAPICEYHGPRGADAVDAFRMTQAAASRLLASVLFGPPPTGSAVGERIELRLKCPFRGNEDRDSQEGRQYQSPKQQMMLSLDSATTKAPSEDYSSSDVDTEDADGKEENDRKRYGFPPPPYGSHHEDSPPRSRDTSESRPRAATVNGFRPPPPRPPLSGLASASAAARAAMQAVPRSEAPLRGLRARSKSTPVLPKLITEIQSPLRCRQGQWIQAESLNEIMSPLVHGVKLKSLQRGQPQQPLEALPVNLNVEIEL